MEKKHLAQEIVKREWVLFDQVHNIGGRASCQDNWPAFYVMRISQFLAWNKSILISYWNDLTEAEQEGRNPLSEKYGYMMEVTSPEEYDRMAAEEFRALGESLEQALVPEEPNPARLKWNC